MKFLLPRIIAFQSTSGVTRGGAAVVGAGAGCAGAGVVAWPSAVSEKAKVVVSARMTVRPIRPVVALLTLFLRTAAHADWFRVNLHTHTLESAGNSTPAAVSNLYADHGYDFL